MANYDYTVVTAKGDVHLTTTSHHTEHGSINNWIAAHQASIANALEITGKRVKVLAVYSDHAKAEQS